MMWRQIKPELHWVLCLFLWLFFTWNRTLQSCQSFAPWTRRKFFSDGRISFFFSELFVHQIRQTTPGVRSFHLLEACKCFEGKNCSNILQSKVARKIILHSFCRETFSTSFCDWNMPTSCSSESWNQHHGELLSGTRKANLLTTVRQIHFILCTRSVVTFLVPETECVQGALRIKNWVILENRVHGC